MAFPVYGISAEEVRAVCGLAPNDNSQDAALENKLRQAIAVFERLCNGRKFVLTEDIKRYNFENVDGELLYLDDEIYEITLVMNGEADVTRDVVPMPQNAGPPYIMLRLPQTAGLWTQDPEEDITVVGKWGFCEEPPTEVKEALLVLTHYYYTLRDTSPSEMITLPNGQQLVVRRGLPQDVMLISKFYKKLWR